MTYSLERRFHVIIGAMLAGPHLYPLKRICGFWTYRYPMADADKTFALSSDFGAL